MNSNRISLTKNVTLENIGYFGFFKVLGLENLDIHVFSWFSRSGGGPDILDTWLKHFSLTISFFYKGA